jgi:hypothetical protein
MDRVAERRNEEEGADWPVWAGRKLQNVRAIDACTMKWNAFSLTELQVSTELFVLMKDSVPCINIYLIYKSIISDTYPLKIYSRCTESRLFYYRPTPLTPF